jgi:hypothetical protein
VNIEEEVYTFENAKLYRDNVPLLRALGLAFMCARNPKETDTDTQMVEVFSKNQPTTPPSQGNERPDHHHSHGGGGTGPILSSQCLLEGCKGTAHESSIS